MNCSSNPFQQKGAILVGLVSDIRYFSRRSTWRVCFALRLVASVLQLAFGPINRRMCQNQKFKSCCFSMTWTRLDERLTNISSFLGEAGCVKSIFDKGKGAAQHIGRSILASRPVAPGLNPGSAKIFALYCLVCEQYWDGTHLVLISGFHKCS